MAIGLAKSIVPQVLRVGRCVATSHLQEGELGGVGEGPAHKLTVTPRW